jgi:hypothetical protein
VNLNFPYWNVLIEISGLTGLFLLEYLDSLEFLLLAVYICYWNLY